jgi:hypothetical protein
MFLLFYQYEYESNRFEGDFVAASPYLEDALSISQGLGDKLLIANKDFILGYVPLGLGNIAGARHAL